MIRSSEVSVILDPIARRVAHERWLVEWSDEIDRWLDAQRASRRLGPGCGSAEFEGSDWRSAVRDRLPNLPGWQREIEAMAGARVPT